MAIHHYEGNLGKFAYDDTLWKYFYNDAHTVEYLYYLGEESDGSKIKIPEGITNCERMFSDCKSLETSPVIPNSVIDCSYMFSGCSNLRDSPTIPDGVKTCKGMFEACKVLAIPPVIPGSAIDCSFMFAHCNSLEAPPIISNGVTNCEFMFYECESLQIPPVVPNSVIYYEDMFEGCSQYTISKGRWNIRHRGWSFDESLRRYKDYIPESFMNDEAKPTDELCSILRAVIKYEESGKHTAYEHVLDGVSNGILTTADDIKHEIQIANKFFARKVTAKSNIDLTKGINFSQNTQLDAGGTKYGYTTS